MLLEKERLDVVEYGKKIAREGLSSGTSGNISIYNRSMNLIAISPSGIDYNETRPEDIVIVDKDGRIVDGDRKPSSELNLHIEMYKVKNDCNAIVHTHSMYCTVFASLRQPLKAVHYVIGDANSSEVLCCPYETYGTKDLAISAAKTIGDSNAVLLANHGVLTCGRNIESAFSLVKTLEYCAELQYRCMAIGNPKVLSDSEMDRVIEKFKGYGQ